MRRLDGIDLLFAALVISVSFAPLMSVPGWQGYGPFGEYACNCGQYFVRFSDPTTGTDRPHVFASYNGLLVDVIQVSDQASSVDGLNLYSNFTARPRIDGGGLEVSYSSHSLNFTKHVSVSNEAVKVSYTFGKNVTALFTLWRWYYASIGHFDRPLTREISTAGDINFTFFDQGALFNASVSASPRPVQARISGIEGAGLNKIALAFNGTKIDMTMTLDAVKPVAGVGVLDVGSTYYAYPIIGVGLSATYLVIRRKLGGRNK
ncbi:MAG: hypothetical protein OK452_10015 [Thaumarchaeota archaeon]|nr:hypothetical protein [Nitrososphaerota archaeon]